MQLSIGVTTMKYLVAWLAVLISAMLVMLLILSWAFSEPGDPIRFELYEDVCLLESGEAWVPVHMKYCKPQGGRTVDLY